MKIISWNVNGLRAILKKDCLTPLVAKEQPDIICLQETKLNQPELIATLPEYTDYWGLGARAGYSGTVTMVKQTIVPLVETLTPPTFLTEEGRLVALSLPHFYLLNVYFPNGGMGPARIDYKLKYYQQFLDYVKELERTKPVIFCGDVNTAHQEIDLARPQANSKTTGFLPAERAWLTRWTDSELVDVWRARHLQTIAYSWWDYKTRARERNVGWRIDYFFASKKIITKIIDCEILTNYFGSDHAPISLTIN